MRADNIKNLIKKLRQSGPVPSAGQELEENVAEAATQATALQENVLGSDRLTPRELPAKRKVKLVRNQPGTDLIS